MRSYAAVGASAAISSSNAATTGGRVRVERLTIV
jgi:hypothetical protein